MMPTFTFLLLVCFPLVIDLDKNLSILLHLFNESVCGFVEALYYYFCLLYYEFVSFKNYSLLNLRGFNFFNVGGL